MPEVWRSSRRIRSAIASPLIALLTLCAPTSALSAQSTRGNEVRRAQAVNANGFSIKIDGALDDEAWNCVQFVTGFTQKDPEEGLPSSERTEVAFLYDDDALYVGARLHCSDPAEIRATVARRDNAGNSERLVVTLDTYHDRRTSYSFGVTATGVRVDYYHPEDNEFRRDYSYDPVWEARTKVNEGGWTAEMRIPFSQLRFRNQENQTWGLNVNRWMPSGNEDAYWVYIPKNETGWASRFGELRGIEGIRPTRRIEIQPYVASDATLTNDYDRDDPFTDGSDFEGRVGGDLKMGLGPNLTLEATANPDFGQVEADPAVVNLTAFEIFFDERRPFFIEGSQLLRGNGPDYFYSRRVGAAPHGGAEGDFVEMSDNTTIIAASKLTGRLNSGLSIGGLTAVTAREHAESYVESTDAFTRTSVEPLTGYGVIRLQQEFGGSQSTVGLSLTGARRDLSSDEELAEILSRQAYAGGGDWRLRFKGGEYVVGGAAGFSYIDGDSAAITQQQRSSRRYFQRPDASHVDLDSSRTSLAGYNYSVWVDRAGGDHWLWGLGTSGESPGFEINDAGRLNQADDLESWGNVRYRENVPGRILRNYRIALFLNNGWNFGGIRQHTSAELNFEGQWNNFWHSWCGVWTGWRALSDNLTRGGPLMGTLNVWSAWFGGANNWASNTNWRFTTSYARDELDTWNLNIDGRLAFRPGTRWELSVSPRYSKSIDGRQYVDTRDGGRDVTFGERHIFSWIERSTLSTQFRLNYAFTPDLTFEVYAEPFASSGRFYDYGELEAPRSRYLVTYGEEGGTTIGLNEDRSRTVTDGEDEFTLGNDDFNVLSFRSNMVLRWEWRRGSTLFLVWQQNRFRDDDQGGLVGGSDLLDSFRAGGENFLAIKVAYWLPFS